MIPTARMTDMAFGFCLICRRPTTGQIISTCPTVLVNNLPIARMGDPVMTTCGHMGNIIQGSNTVLAKSISVSRIGDSVTGMFIANIIQGSTNVLCK